jgi:hypothetical protein
MDNVQKEHNICTIFLCVSAKDIGTIERILWVIIEGTFRVVS